MYRGIFLQGRFMRLPDVEFARRAFLNPNTESIPYWHEAENEGAGGSVGRLVDASLETYFKRLDETGDALPSHLNYGFVRWLQGVPPLDLQALHARSDRDEEMKFRSLAVHAENDIIFGPDCAESFVQDFGSELLVCRDQAHCFLDRGWEDAFARPLGQWLTKNEVVTSHPG